MNIEKSLRNLVKKLQVTFGWVNSLHFTRILCGITAQMLISQWESRDSVATGVFIKQVWQSGLIPSDWKGFLPVYKGKGSPKELQELQGHNSPVSSRQGIRHGTAKQSLISCTSQNGAEWVHAWSVND